MSNHRVIASWVGYCASCPTEQPLLLVSHGPQGVRGWLSGAGPEDRTLSYACAVCGQTEHVPASEEEDVAYDAALLRWPDWAAAATAHAPVAEEVTLAAGDVFGLAARRLVAVPSAPVELLAVVPAPRTAPSPRVPLVRIVGLPVSRISATDLVLAVA